MTEEPPSPDQSALLKFFAEVGLGPNQSLDKLDDAVKRGLVRAAKDGKPLLKQLTEISSWPTTNS